MQIARADNTVATVLVQHACDISNSTQGQKKALPKAVINRCKALNACIQNLAVIFC